MDDEKILKNSPTVKIDIFENTKQLGRVLSHKGTLEILCALQERPKQYKELDDELQLPNTTFENALNELHKSIRVIKKNQITSDNRETHQYTLSRSGKELTKFINIYERIMAMPSSQQKLIEIENK